MLILKAQETQKFNLICTSRYIVKHTLDLLDKIGLGAMEKLKQLVKRKCKANISTTFYQATLVEKKLCGHKNLQFYCLNSTTTGRGPFKVPLLNLFIFGINTNSSNMYLVVKAKGGAAKKPALSILHFFRLSEVQIKLLLNSV